MDKSKLKEIVQKMSEKERSELGQLLLESVLERWSEEGDSEPEDGQNIGGFDVIVDEEDESAPS